MPLRSTLAFLLAASLTCFTACKKTPGSGSGSTNKYKKDIRIGVIADAAAAPIIVAQTQEFFKKHGLEVTLTPLDSTESVARELALGNLEAGMVYPGDALTPGETSDLVVPHILARNTDTLSVSRETWAAMSPHLLRDVDGQPVLPIHADALVMAAQSASLQFQIPSTKATCTYTLGYWLAAAGITPSFDGDSGGSIQAQLTTDLPSGPLQGQAGSFESQSADQITLLSSANIVRDLPSMVLATRGEWTTANEETTIRAIAALIEAGQWLDASMENRRLAATAVASNLGGDPGRFTQWLTGDFPLAGKSDSSHDHITFSRHGSAAPDHLHAQWILTQMSRWGQVVGIETDADIQSTVERTFLPRLFVEAVKRTGALMPGLRMRLDAAATLEHVIDGNQFRPRQASARQESL